MNLMCPDKCVIKTISPLLLLILISGIAVFGQAKKPVAKKATAKPTASKAVAKTDGKKKKDASKVQKNTNANAKNAKSNQKSVANSTKGKAAIAKKDTKDKKKDSRTTSKTTAKEVVAKNLKGKKAKIDPKILAKQRQEAAERERQEEARRQAALAEQRRREQLAREARARKIAFEQGLHTETANNIQKDNSDGEDLQIRTAAVEALGNRAGTVVVMEAKTGKIVTIVNQDWAIKNGFKPCSTIKLVTAVAGISENVINEDGGIGSSASGMKLNNALAYSNNGYFQRVGSSVGNSKMIEYAKDLGLGEPTGINAEAEASGRLPYGNSNPRIYSHGDDFEVTPLQLAVLVSALSNGGKKVVPQIQKKRTERTFLNVDAGEKVVVPTSNMEGVLPGMVGAAEYGTARRGVDAGMGVAGKTGSCIEKGSWVGLFASVAPVEDPKYSVVVITRGERERGRYAADVAGKIYQALRSRIVRNMDLAVAKHLVKPIAEPDENIASIDEEEYDDNGGELESRPIIVGKSQAGVTAPSKKMVQKTSQSKPVFKPVIISVDPKETQKNRPRVIKNK